MVLSLIMYMYIRYKDFVEERRRNKKYEERRKNEERCREWGAGREKE